MLPVPFHCPSPRTCLITPCLPSSLPSFLPVYHRHWCHCPGPSLTSYHFPSSYRQVLSSAHVTEMIEGLGHPGCRCTLSVPDPPWAPPPGAPVCKANLQTWGSLSPTPQQVSWHGGVGAEVTFPFCPGAPIYQHNLDQGAHTSGFRRNSFSKSFMNKAGFESLFYQNKVFFRSN